MEKIAKKPKLVYFQWDHSAAPKFLWLHTQLHVKCLTEFFEVTVINKDCDYQQICDIYQPDLALFEGGFKTSFSRRLNIKRTSSYPSIPKLGFHNGDPWCDCRPGFLSEMDRWGIETFFSISTTLAEHTPEIADNVFVWPNFIDNEIHKDYNQFKTAPILFNGSMISLYPWRKKIYDKVNNRFPVLTFPHLGYESKSPFMINGEQYARTINASWIVPACGSVAKEIVRKHFEIPGCKSCLITERSASLEAAGFVDMQNCVFADENNIIDKVNYLFKDKAHLEQIIDSGFKLVHSRHTLKQRDQILQWFKLNRSLKGNEIIVQSNPFEPMRIEQKSLGIKSQPIKCNGIHLELLSKGDEMLFSGEYEKAETFYRKCLSFISSMSEPKLKLAICNLHNGRVKDAWQFLIQPIEYNLGIYGSSDPDPVEWAYYIILLLCQGKLNEAIIRTNQFPLLNHIELERIRLVINCLQDKDDFKLLSDNRLIKYRKSIHILPQYTFSKWISNLCSMLKACQQIELAGLLMEQRFSKEEIGRPVKTNYSIGRQLKWSLLYSRIHFIEKVNLLFELLHVPPGRRGLPPISLVDYNFRILKWIKIKATMSFYRVYRYRNKTKY